MDPGGLKIFRHAEQRLNWLDQRQQVLAQNVANADTPGYAARDLKPFAARVDAAMQPARTNAGHLGSGQARSGGARIDRAAGETSMNGNRVALDEQLVKVSETEFHQGLTTSLYRKYVNLFRTALGRNG
jgi:flagellar basal-body rod protein FlgB